MRTVLLDQMRLIAGGEPLYLPEFLAAALEGRSGTAFFIPENRGSQVANDEHFSTCFERLHQYPVTKDDIVFIDRSTEVGSIRSRLGLLRRLVASAGLSMDQVVYVSQNPKAALNAGEGGPRWLFFHNYVASMSRKFRDVAIGDFQMEQAGPTILCLNSKIRPHRLAMAAELQRLFPDRALTTWQGATALFNRDSALKEIAERLPSFLHSAATVALNDFHLPAGFGVGGAEDFPKTESIAAYLHVVTESDYLPQFERFTEKSLKPIAAHRPFVVFGPQHVLKRLRDLGFRTFSPIIDESYDDIESPDERLKAVIRALVDLTRQDHREVLRACFEICAFNQGHLRNGVEGVMATRLSADLARILDPQAAVA